jgi:hypothetical protein
MLRRGPHKRSSNAAGSRGVLLLALIAIQGLAWLAIPAHGMKTTGEAHLQDIVADLTNPHAGQEEQVGGRAPRNDDHSLRVVRDLQHVLFS